VNSVLKANQAQEKFYGNSTDIFFNRTMEDILNASLFDDSLDDDKGYNEVVYRVDIGVPGLTRNDIVIRVDGRVIWVSTKRQEPGQWQRWMDFNSKHLERSFDLPSDADVANIRAKCRNGLLTIHIGKMKADGAHRIIPISGDVPIGATKVKAPAWWTRMVDKAQRLLPGWRK
jgi:HSP20 family molecular chaperone IbpA